MSSKKIKQGRISRRSFLKGAALASVGIAASHGIPPFALAAPFSSKKKNPETFSEKWLSTSCLNCAAGCAIEVRVVNGKAVNIRGNAFSRAAEGKICPRGFLGLQVLYDPDRVPSPLKRTSKEKGRNIDPRWVPISWEEALGEVSRRLQSLRQAAEPHRVLILQGLNSASNEDLIHRFADAYGTPNVISGDGLENEAEKSGRWMADGHLTHIAYDLNHTNYILAFGASILESHKPLARNLRMWGKIRRERPIRAKVVVLDPRYSVTADKADEWIPIQPGTDGALAMAIAYVIISEGLYDADFIRKWTGGFEEYKELVLGHYSPEKAAGITGIPSSTIRRIAREFAQTKPAIAWVGTGATRWPNGTYNAYAIFCLNALAGSIDVPGGIVYQEYPPYQKMPKPAEDRIAKEGRKKPRIDYCKTDRFPLAEVVTNQVVESILENRPYAVDMAIGVNSNFNMPAPGGTEWDRAMQKLPYYVHIAPFISEMARYADLFLPASTFLEEWAYDHSPPGPGFAEARIKQPVVKPWAESKAVADIIFELARRQGGTVGQSFGLQNGDAKGFIQYRTATLIPWKEFLEKGVWVGPPYQYQKYDRIFRTPSRRFEFSSGNLKKAIPVKDLDQTACLPHYEPVQFHGEMEKYPFILVTYQPLLYMENGSQSYPWAQEIFSVMHGQGWTNFVEINSQTARSLRLRDGDWVWVESLFGKMKGRVKSSEGTSPQIVCMARGQGHSAGGRWAKGMGVNPQEIVGVDYDRLSGQAAFFNTRVKIYKA